MRGHGRILPIWFDARDPEAQRGTVRLRSIDPNLIAGLNRKRGVYEIWGPSTVQAGWVPLVECSDDYGKPYRGNVPWDLICISIARARQDGESAVDRVLAHNERLRASRQATIDDRNRASVQYAQKAIADEWDSASRFSSADVMLGLKNADEGRSKRTAEERTELISLPGRTPAGKGRAVAG
jgi:hypothetical protein